MKGLREPKTRAKVHLEVSVLLHKPARAVAPHYIIFLLKKCRIFYHRTTFLEQELVATLSCVSSNFGTACTRLGLLEGSYELSLPM